MPDRTAVTRVKRYRSVQRGREITRLEVQVPEALAGEAKSLARRWRTAFAALQTGRGPVDFVLGTINAPRPRPIDARTLLAALMASTPIPEWQPHIEALFDEVSPEALHDLVLAGVVDFEDLYRAIRVWKVQHGRTAEWVREMADFGLADASTLRSQAA